MPITKDGLVYNHIARDAYIFHSYHGQYHVRFREEIGVSFSVRETVYPSKEKAQLEIDAFLGGVGSTMLKDVTPEEQ